MLSVKNLHASVDDKEILRGIDLDVKAGEVHAIMGPNGSGKSTLASVLAGNEKFTVTAGSATFQGHDLLAMSIEDRARLGLFLGFQYPVEIPGVPLSSFLRATVEGREGFKMKGKEFRKHVRELAKSLDFDPAYLDRELGVGFSGGEKKKLEMLQLLLLKPKLAVLDETDSGLDVDALGVVSRGIQEYRKTCDGTLIIITHNTRILEHVDVDRVHVMVKGHLVHEDDAALIADIDAHGFERFEQAATPEADA